MKRILLAVALAAVSALSFGQYARTSGTMIDETWRDSLTSSQISTVERIAKHKNDTQRWMIYTAVVRSKDARSFHMPSEKLDKNKILANITVRMDLDETNRWQSAWRRLSGKEQKDLLAVFKAAQRG